MSPTAPLSPPPSVPKEGAKVPRHSTGIPELQGTPPGLPIDRTDTERSEFDLPSPKKSFKSRPARPGSQTHRRDEKHTTLGDSEGEYGEAEQGDYCDILDRRDPSFGLSKPHYTSSSLPPGLFNPRPSTTPKEAYLENGTLRPDISMEGLRRRRKKKASGPAPAAYINQYSFNEIYVQKHQRLKSMYDPEALQAVEEVLWINPDRVGNEEQVAELAAKKIPWMGMKKKDKDRGATLKSHPCFEFYEVGKMVGSGQYGEVYYGSAPTGLPVAMKKIEWDYTDDRCHHGFPLTAVREIKILKLINHKNVVRLMDVVTAKSVKGEEHKCKPFDIYMVMERAQNDLSGIIHGMSLKKIPRFQEAEYKSVCQQILEGTHYLHTTQKIKILHRDFKPSNILLTTQGQVKICDFGLARRFKKDRALTNEGRVISRWYRSPEILLGTKHYGPSVDVWSVGCIFAEMLRLKPAFPAQQEILQMTYIMQVCGSYNDENWPDWQEHCNTKSAPEPREHPRRVKEHFQKYVPANWSKQGGAELLDVIDAMLTLDPNKRANAGGKDGLKGKRSALQMPYFHSKPAPIQPKFKSGDDHHELRYDARPGRKRWKEKLEERNKKKRKTAPEEDFKNKFNKMFAGNSNKKAKSSGPTPQSKERDGRRHQPRQRHDTSGRAHKRRENFEFKAVQRRGPQSNHGPHGRHMTGPISTGPVSSNRRHRTPGTGSFAVPLPRPPRTIGREQQHRRNPFNPNDGAPPSQPQLPPRPQQRQASGGRGGYGPDRGHSGSRPRPGPGSRAPQRAQQQHWDARGRQSGPGRGARPPPGPGSRLPPPGHTPQPRQTQGHGPPGHGHRGYGPPQPQPMGAPYNPNPRRGPQHNAVPAWGARPPERRPPNPERRMQNRGQNHQRNPGGGAREGRQGARRDEGRQGARRDQRDQGGGQRRQKSHNSNMRAQPIPQSQAQETWDYF